MKTHGVPIYCCCCGRLCTRKAIKVNEYGEYLCKDCQQEYEGVDLNTGDPIGYDDNEF